MNGYSVLVSYVESGHGGVLTLMLTAKVVEGRHIQFYMPGGARKTLKELKISLDLKSKLNGGDSRNE